MPPPRPRPESKAAPALSKSAQQRFGFAQLDFPGTVGLSDGRYLIRDAQPTGGSVVPEDGEATQPIILVTQTLAGAPKPRRSPGRRPGHAAQTPGEVPVVRLTVVFSDRPFGDESAASDWMLQISRDEELRTALISAAISYINRALHAASIAAADPYQAELGVSQALAGRIGHGLGPELADGRFSECIEIPTVRQRRRRRTDEVSPLERVAAILSGRKAPDLCETFLLRARADLNAGRNREATLGLAVAIDSLLLELNGTMTGEEHRSDLTLVAANKADVAEIASRARLGPIAQADVARIGDMLAVCERVLRRRQLLRG